MKPVCTNEEPRTEKSAPVQQREEGAAGQGAGTATAERPKTAPPVKDALPPFKVLLHNDPVNDMLYVVRAIIELTPLGKEKALEVMFEAHTSGCALLLVTHRERAELYSEQFRTKKLTVTIEPA